MKLLIATVCLLAVASAMPLAEDERKEPAALSVVPLEKTIEEKPLVKAAPVPELAKPEAALPSEQLRAAPLEEEKKPLEEPLVKKAEEKKPEEMMKAEEKKPEPEPMKEEMKKAAEEPMKAEEKKPEETLKAASSENVMIEHVSIGNTIYSSRELINRADGI